MVDRPWQGTLHWSSRPQPKEPLRWAGPAAEDRLEALAPPGSGAPLGWLCSRPGTSLAAPSMREAAVTASLHQLLRRRCQDGGGGAGGQDTAHGGVPTLLLVLTSGQEHGGATLSLEQRWA